MMGMGNEGGMGWGSAAAARALAVARTPRADEDMGKKNSSNASTSPPPQQQPPPNKTRLSCGSAKRFPLTSVSSSRAATAAATDAKSPPTAPAPRRAAREIPSPFAQPNAPSTQPQRSPPTAPPTTQPHQHQPHNHNQRHQRIVPAARRGECDVDHLPLPPDQGADAAFEEFDANWEAAAAEAKAEGKAPRLMSVRDQAGGIGTGGTGERGREG